MKISSDIKLSTTPTLLISKSEIVHSVAQLKSYLPHTSIHYAVKANPDIGLLKQLKSLGVGFEIASINELESLIKIGIRPAEVLYSTPVKPPHHIAQAYKHGVSRFSFDSNEELQKLTQYAPGSKVILRVRVNDDRSKIPLSKKYGAPYGKSVQLLAAAAKYGLKPYGLTFHVGSQSTGESAWSEAIYICEAIMRKLEQNEIKIEVLNLGGGFPIDYMDTTVPSIRKISSGINKSLQKLPYSVKTIIEPGRFIAGPAGTLITTIIGKEQRDDRCWLYTDVGAFHGLMETMKCQGDIQYHVELVNKRITKPMVSYIITGPTCDSMDTWGRNVLLPASLEVGDKLAIRNTGAYTLSFAAPYNGFPIPNVLYVS